MKGINVLVTGGTGFIGSYLTRSLVEAGHRVVCFDQIPAGNSFDQVIPDELKQQVTVIAGDVTDAIAMAKTIREHDIETVVHLATLTIPASNADPRRALYVNCQSFIELLELARLLPLRRVVWASSVAVFGDRSLYGDQPIPDDALHKPTTIYGATKSLNEVMAQHYFDEFGVDNIGLRYTIVYGHGRLRGASAFAAQMLQSAALEQPTVVPYADQMMDWQYVEDAAGVTLAAVEAKEPTKTRVFNTGGIRATPRQAAEVIRELLPGVELTIQPGQFGKRLYPDFSVAGAEQELGYKSKFDLAEGIRRTINSIRQQAGLPPV